MVELSKLELASLGILTGNDAKRFEERIQKTKPIDPKEKERLVTNCRAILKKANL